MDTPIYYSDLIKPDDSIEKLVVQLQQLSQQFSSNINKIKEEAQGLQTALKGVSGATEEGRKTTQQASTDVEKLANQHRKLAEAESENNRELQRLKSATSEANKIMKLEAQLANSAEGSYNKLSAQYALNKIRLNQMSEAERTATAEGQKLVRESNNLYQSMKRLQAETGQHQLNVGNYPDMTNALQGISTQITGLIGLNGQLGSSFLMLGQNAGGATPLIAGLGTAFATLGKTLWGLMKNPVFLAVAGIASALYGIKQWYDYNTGVAEATRLTREFADVSGQELTELRTYISAIAETWDKDYKETLQSIDAVAANFKISFQEAAEAIRDGFVAGADVNGDFLSKLKQYPAYFKEAGLNVRQFVAILQQTRSGIFGDKGLDAIKQANARIREMKDNVKNVLNELNLGMNAEEIEAQLTAGAMTTFDVLQMVSNKLAELPPQSALVGETLVTVFGKQGRDAGLEMVKALGDIETNLDVCMTKTGEFGEMQKAQMEAEQELQKALATLFNTSSGGFDRMTGSLKILATKGFTMLINKIIDVVNWFINLYNKSSLVRKGFYTFGKYMIAVFTVVGNVLGGVVKMIEGVFEGLEALYNLVIEHDIGKAWKNIKQGFSDVAEGQMKITAGNAKAIYNLVKSIGDYEDHLAVPLGWAESNAGQMVMGITNSMTGGNIIKADDVNVLVKDTTHIDTGADNGDNDNNNSPFTRDRNTRTYSYGRPVSASSVNVPSRQRGETEEQRLKREKAEREKAIREQEQAYRRSLQLQRQREDEQMKLKYQGEALRRQQLLKEYDRMKQDLQHQLQVESEILSKDDKKNIEARIQAIEQMKVESLEALKKWEEEQKVQREIAKEKENIALLKKEKEGIDLRLQSVKDGSAEEMQLRLEQLKKEEEIAQTENRINMLNGEEDRSEDIKNKFLTERINLYQQVGKMLDSTYEKQQQLANSEIDLLNTSERKKTQLRLQAEKERIQKLLGLQKMGLVQMTDEELKIYQNQLALIDKELKSSPYGDIYDVFGLDITEEQKKGINESLQYAQEAITTFMQSYVQSAEQKAQLADKAVEDAKRVVDTEIEARANGYASNVEYAQKELDQAKRMQEKAHQQAVTAQRQQILLDSAQQASSMITATANIWKAFTGTGPWGVAAAIAATATMWGSFMASKVKAMSMVGQDEEYGEGTVELLQGGSHQSGNDVDLGRKADGTRRRAEGGEFFAVINKRNSRRFRHIIPDVINSLNDGSFPSKYMNAVKTEDGIIFNLNNGADITDLSADVSAIRRQNERKAYVDGNGNTIIVYNNLKRTIRR